MKNYDDKSLGRVVVDISAELGGDSGGGCCCCCVVVSVVVDVAVAVDARNALTSAKMMKQ